MFFVRSYLRYRLYREKNHDYLLWEQSLCHNINPVISWLYDYLHELFHSEGKFFTQSEYFYSMIFAVFYALNTTIDIHHPAKGRAMASGTNTLTIIS